VGGDSRRRRLDRLRAGLPDRGLDALLVSAIPNIRYLTGFSGSSAVAVVGHDTVSLLTDGRYGIQAPAEVEGVAEVAIVDGNLWEAVRGALAGVGRVGFEADAVTAAVVGELEDTSGVEFVPTTKVVEGLRVAKDREEVAAITAAARVAVEAWDAALPLVRSGLREVEVAGLLERELRVRGSEWHPFPTIVASGPRSALPHAGTTNRTIERGDWLLLDFGAQVDGYCADVTRTVVVGRRADQRQREVYAVVREAQAQAIAKIRAGMLGKEADAQARSAIVARGLGEAFSHSLGHGLGLEVHEAPRLARTSEDRLPEGCVVTVEPGVYLAEWGGVRIEDDVLVTADGAQVLSGGTTELVEVV
jgi:Xaa-Pro aminopeptidase